MYFIFSILSKKKLPDEKVIDLYLATQSSQYFGILYNRYSTKVYSKCLSLLKSEALAQDAAQEIFTKIFLNLAKFNRKSRFSTWIYSITYNFCIDYLRKRKKENKLFSNDDSSDLPDVIDDEANNKELLEMEIGRLAQVLELLPIEDKAVLLMKYKDDMSIKEISAHFQKSESAIKMKIKRAKQKAKVIYQKKFSNVA